MTSVIAVASQLQPTSSCQQSNKYLKNHVSSKCVSKIHLASPTIKKKTNPFKEGSRFLHVHILGRFGPFFVSWWLTPPSPGYFSQPQRRVLVASADPQQPNQCTTHGSLRVFFGLPFIRILFVCLFVCFGWEKQTVNNLYNTNLSA